MFNHYLTNELTTGAINELIEDRFRQYGANYNSFTWESEYQYSYSYVVDSVEIRNYCFPIKPWSTVDRFKMARIIDSQIAYDAIFRSNKNPPIVTSEYKEEVKEFIQFFSNMMPDLSYDKMYFRNYFDNIVDAYHSAGSDLNDDLDLKVSFRLSLMSFGAERLSDLNSRFGLVNNAKKDALESIKLNTKIKSEVVEEVYKKISLFDENVTIEAVKRDVVVIYKIIELNKINHLKYKKNNKIRKKLIFYFSSAKYRTVAIMDALQSKGIYLEINGTKISLWRSPLQLFQYLISRIVIKEKNGNLLIDTNRTIEQLKDFKKGLLELKVHKLKEIDSGQTKKVIERIYEFRKNSYLKDIKKFENVSLSKYFLPFFNLGSLLDQRHKAHNQLSKEFHKYADEILSNEFSKDANLSLRNLKTSMAIKRSFATLISSQNPLSNGDIVTNVFDSFPLDIVFNNQKNNEHAKSLRSFWKDLYFKVKKGENNPVNFDPLIGTIDILLEEGIEDDVSAIENKIIKTLLYLLNPTEESSIMAIERLDKLIATDESYLFSNGNTAYLYVWVLRRNKEYLNSFMYAEYVNENYKDPRLQYGYILAVQSYILSEQNYSKTYNLEIASKALDFCVDIEEYQPHSGKLNQYYRSAFLSNKIYIFSYNAKGYRRLEYLKEADKALRELKRLTPKADWKIYYPEYLHTEAYFEYVSAHLNFNDGIRNVPNSNWYSRINSAIRDLESAIMITPAHKIKIYVDLKVLLSKIYIK